MYSPELTIVFYILFFQLRLLYCAFMLQYFVRGIWYDITIIFSKSNIWFRKLFLIHFFLQIYLNLFTFIHAEVWTTQIFLGDHDRTLFQLI